MASRYDKYLNNRYFEALNKAKANVYPSSYPVDSGRYEAIMDVLSDLGEDFIEIIDKNYLTDFVEPVYEYLHVCDNQMSKVRGNIVKLLNEGWELMGGMESTTTRSHVVFHEYSQIMRRIKQ